MHSQIRHAFRIAELKAGHRWHFWQTGFHCVPSYSRKLPWRPGKRRLERATVANLQHRARCQRPAPQHLRIVARSEPDSCSTLEGPCRKLHQLHSNSAQFSVDEADPRLPAPASQSSTDCTQLRGQNNWMSCRGQEPVAVSNSQAKSPAINHIRILRFSERRKTSTLTLRLHEYMM